MKNLMVVGFIFIGLILGCTTVEPTGKIKDKGVYGGKYVITVYRRSTTETDVYHPTYCLVTAEQYDILKVGDMYDTTEQGCNPNKLELINP